MLNTDKIIAIASAIETDTLIEAANSVGMSHTEVLAKVTSIYNLYKTISARFANCKDSKALTLAALIYVSELMTATGVSDKIAAWFTFVHNAVVGVARNYTTSFWGKFGSWFRSSYNVLCTGAKVLTKLAEEAGAAPVESAEEK